MNFAKIIKLILTLCVIISIKSNYAQTLRMKTRAVVRENTNLPKVRARLALKYPISEKLSAAGSRNKMRLRMKIRIVKPEN